MILLHRVDPDKGVNQEHSVKIGNPVLCYTSVIFGSVTVSKCWLLAIPSRKKPSRMLVRLTLRSKEFELLKSHS